MRNDKRHAGTENQEELEQQAVNTGPPLAASTTPDAAEAMLDTILEHTPALIAFMDTEFNFIRVNHAYAASIEKTPDYFNGKNHFDLFPHEENEDIFRNVVKTGVPYSIAAKPFEFPQYPERGVSWWDWSLVPVKDGSGAVVSLLMTLADVSDRVRNAQEIEELAKFPSENPNPVMRVSAGGAVDYANDAALGALAPLNLGRGGAMPAEFESVVQRAFDSGRIEYFDLQVNKRYFYFVVTPLPQKGYANLYGTDITERRRAQKQLDRSEKRYTELVENLDVGIWSCDREGNTVFVNPAMADMLGYTREEMAGVNVFSVIVQDDWGKGYETFENRMSGRPGTTEYTYRRRDGSHIIVLSSSTPTYDDAGNVSGAIGIIKDITEKRKTENALMFEREQLLSIFDSIEEFIYVSDPETHEILYANGAMKNTFGEAVGRKCHDVIHGELFPCAFCTNEKLFGENAVESYCWDHYNEKVGRWYRRSERAIWWPDGRRVRFELAVDITGRKEMEQSLEMNAKHLEALVEDRTRELSELSHKLIRAQEEERARISRNLHDEIGQKLMALGMEVEWLQKKGDIATADLDNMASALENLAKEIHSVYQGLRPESLEKLGLKSAIEALAWEYRDTAPFKIRCKLDPDACDLDESFSIITYRIAQETLTNIARHSEADRVHITMDVQGEDSVLVIRDDGKGFDPDGIRKKGRFGLAGMRERAAAVGARLAVVSLPGEGTEVKLFIPRNREEKEADD